jgi:hypothetical protein
MAAKMKLVSVGSVHSHKQGTLTGLTKAEIDRALGFSHTSNGDGGYKVKYDWCFTANSVECAIWDWKGSDKLGEWSFYGPKEVFQNIFGTHHVAEGLYA